MKLPLPSGQLLAIEAPVLPAYAVAYMGSHRWFVWCKHCRDWHIHGSGDGHREAHCSEQTPYSTSGYNLALRGVMSPAQARVEKERRINEEPSKGRVKMQIANINKLGNGLKFTVNGNKADLDHLMASLKSAGVQAVILNPPGFDGTNLCTMVTEGDQSVIESILRANAKIF